MKTKKISRALLPLLALTVWLVALFMAQRMGAFAQPVSVRFSGEGSGVSPVRVRQAERYAREDGRENIPTMTLFQELGSQLLADESGTRSASVTMLEGYGEGGEMYPAGFLFGGYPARGDTQGIALDAAAASNLWGSTGTLGQSVCWNGKTYYLRGVFEGQRGLAIVQDSDESDKVYPNLLLRMPEGGTDGAAAFLNSAGMGGGTVLDLPFLAWCMGVFSALPGLLLAGAILGRLFRRGWSLRYTPLLLGQYLLPALAGGALTLWGLGFPWEIPAKIIPTRWSNLNFWGELAGEVGRGVRGIFAHALGQRDVALLLPALFCLLMVPVACTLVVMALGRPRVRTLNGLLAGGILSMTTVFVLVLALAPMGGVSVGREMWTLPLLWLLANLFLSAHEGWLKPKTERREPDETTYPALEAESPDSAALGTTGV